MSGMICGAVLGHVNLIGSLLSGAQLGYRARAGKYCPEKHSPGDLVRTKKNICHFRVLPERSHARKNIVQKKHFWVGDASAAAATIGPDCLISKCNPTTSGPKIPENPRRASRAGLHACARKRNIPASGSLRERARAQEKNIAQENQPCCTRKKHCRICGPPGSCARKEKHWPGKNILGGRRPSGCDYQAAENLSFTYGFAKVL